MSSSTRLSLRFEYPPQSYHSDIRTFKIIGFEEGHEDTTELYKFDHPANGMAIGSTNFERKDKATGEWDRIGHIEWTSPLTGTIEIGDEEIDMKDLRKIKNGTSTSRRFKYKGVEYKWKINDNKDDIYCIDPQETLVAKWYQDRKVLRLSTRRTGLIERLLVTCLLNMWFREKGTW